ncbi:hypothetical protein P879_00475 [Paragonimus westermani]|uniref:Aminomethyltransferase n=1 Tax=Paragonimus westermani TaxID=34504 RepID=A0A8T0DWM3_9TREM|nr:hypothetical protein P879_00475 [Paragonimus westermani]
MSCVTKFRNFFIRPSLVRAKHSKAMEPKRTPFYDFHLTQGAKLIEFCGFAMPIQYESQNILDSHHHVRNHCGIFDVSHMLQVKVLGNDRVNFMESLTTADLVNLPAGSGTLSVYLNESGGILDDVIINVCKEPYLYVVSNAACAEKISKHLKENQETFRKLGKDVTVELSNDKALVAIQGPEAHDIVRTGIPSAEWPTFDDLFFMETAQFSSFFGLCLESEPIRITRCGYTGEDGYEVSLPAQLAVELGHCLMKVKQVKPIGLAARDTLRLEAGMCLYGNDLDETTTPIEASLNWLVGKRRRQITAQPLFPGAEYVLNQLYKKTPITRKRIGLKGEFGPQARPGSKIFAPQSDIQVGNVTSGCLSPTLGQNIAMAYVKPDFISHGQELAVEIRKKLHKFTVCNIPFVQNRYVRRPKSN